MDMNKGGKFTRPGRGTEITVSGKSPELGKFATPGGPTEIKSAGGDRFPADVAGRTAFQGDY